MRISGLIQFVMLVTMVAALAFLGLLLARARPQDVPWTELDLGDPVGAFTGRKLTALRSDAPACHALLNRAGIAFTKLPTRAEGHCGYSDGVRMRDVGPLAIAYQPAGLATSCAVAASLAAWEWHVVQPAAIRHYGRTVVAIDHFGSYSCRRLYGRSSGDWSEHATANAVDIAGFRLEGGRRISVARDWKKAGRDAAFLHEVRDGACRLFATVLSPDYNAAHHDHLHLDQASRGVAGWRACR